MMLIYIGKRCSHPRSLSPPHNPYDVTHPYPTPLPPNSSPPFTFIGKIDLYPPLPPSHPLNPPTPPFFITSEILDTPD